MVSDALDIQFLLLENYKRFKLNEEEMMVILMIDHLLSLGNSLITSEALALKMSLDNSKIDDILANLFTRGFLTFETKNNQMTTSIEPLKQLLFRDFKMALSLEQDKIEDKKMKDELDKVFKQFENIFARELTSFEKKQLHEWIISNISSDTLINALKEVSKKKKNPTLYDVDKLLCYWKSRDDIEIEGHTTVSSSWDKSLDETIRIAKTPWLDDDE